MDKVKALLTGDEPVKWLFYGDSITHGALHTWGHRDYTQLFAERVRFELSRTMDIVLNTAISGNTTPALLNSYDWRVKQFNPHVVFVMIGMNDCSSNNDITPAQFTVNLETLADRLEDLGALAVFQTTCPILPGSAPDREPHFHDFMDAVRSVARQRSIPIVDHTHYWSQHADNHYYWMNNAFHPNECGHRAFANLLFEALGIFDLKSPTCRLFVASR